MAPRTLYLTSWFRTPMLMRSVSPISKRSSNDFAPLILSISGLSGELFAVPKNTQSKEEEEKMVTMMKVKSEGCGEARK